MAAAMKRFALAAAMLFCGNAVPVDEEGIRIMRAASGKTAAAASAPAYELLRRNRLPEARSAYAEALRRDPRDIDALLGAAAVAQRLGDAQEAGDHYRHALAADPANPYAQAGLLTLHGASAPYAAESRLRELLARYPGSAPLLTALAALHAGRGRWDEAHHAWKQALAADRDDPDLRYNLAVSLDRLHRPGLAAHQYRAALDALAGRPGNFDAPAVARRLAELTAAPRTAQ